MRENALRRRLNGEALPAPSEASPNLARIILKACENNPLKRFESATEMKLVLQAHLEGKNVFQEAAPNRTVNRKGQGQLTGKIWQLSEKRITNPKEERKNLLL